MTDIVTLKRQMVAAHPDRGGSECRLYRGEGCLRCRAGRHAR